MSVDELKSLKEKLGLSHLGAIPKPDFVEIVMGLQASVQFEPKPPVGSTATSFSSSHTNLKPAGSSAASGPASDNASGVNPATGLMECGMCFEPMGGGASRQLAVPPCGHAYCYDCLVRVARQPAGGAKCPGCRQPFTEQSITRVFG